MFIQSVNQRLKEIRKKPKENIFIDLLTEIKFLSQFISEILAAPSKSLIQKIIRKSKSIYEGNEESKLFFELKLETTFDSLIQQEILKRKKKKKRMETLVLPKESLNQKEKVEIIKEKSANPTTSKVENQKKLLPLPYSLEEMKSKYFQDVKVDMEKDLKLNSNLQNKMYQRIKEHRALRELKENEKIIGEMKQFLKEKLKSNPLTQKELERRKYWEEINN
jgi:hypothetical protein